MLLAQLDFTLATHCCRSEAQPAVQPEVRLAAVQTYASFWNTRFIKSLPHSSVELLENGVLSFSNFIHEIEKAEGSTYSAVMHDVDTPFTAAKSVRSWPLYRTKVPSDKACNEENARASRLVWVDMLGAILIERGDTLSTQCVDELGERDLENAKV